jgi:hypothetical protein
VFGQQIELQGQSLSTAAQSLGFDAAGSLHMAANAQLTGSGNALSMRAQQDLTVSAIDVGSSGQVSLMSLHGQVSDSGQDSAVDVRAGSFTLYGNGPAMAAGGSALAVLRVDAAQVQIDSPDGLVLRSSEGGDSVFTLAKGSELYRQAVVVGQAQRSTDAPQQGPLPQTQDASLQHWLGGAGAQASSASAGGWMSSLLAPVKAAAAVGGVQAYLSDLRALGSSDDLGLDDELPALGGDGGLAQRLEQAYLLGARASQPTSSGLGSVGSDVFDYWEDALATL